MTRLFKLSFIFLFLIAGCDSKSGSPKASVEGSKGYDPKESIQGFSHINIVVDDIEYATEFYKRTLGFEKASNADGEMDYTDVNLQTFARSAGFLDGKPVKVHVRFLQHPKARIFLEVMRYYQPVGNNKVHVHKVNDIGGARHIGFEVSDAVAAFHYLKKQPDVKMINPSKDYKEPEILGPVNIRFFYWVDPWGVHWEMEEGRPIGDARAAVG